MRGVEFVCVVGRIEVFEGDCVLEKDKLKLWEFDVEGGGLFGSWFCG